MSACNPEDNATARRAAHRNLAKVRSLRKVTAHVLPRRRAGAQALSPAEATRFHWLPCPGYQFQVPG